MKCFLISPFLFIPWMGFAMPFDIEHLTYDAKIWVRDVSSVPASFGAFDWRKYRGGLKAGKEEMTLWQMPVQSVQIIGSEDGKVSEVQIGLGVGGIAEIGFIQKAEKWKQTLDQKLRSVGRRQALLESEGQKIERVVWRTPSTEVMLVLTSSEKLKSLRMSIIKSAVGEAVLTPRRDVNLGSKDTLIKRALEGITKSLSGSAFVQKPIIGNPDYYLFFFAASW